MKREQIEPLRQRGGGFGRVMTGLAVVPDDLAEDPRDVARQGAE